jgi:hypothetical protein
LATERLIHSSSVTAANPTLGGTCKTRYKRRTEPQRGEEKVGEAEEEQVGKRIAIPNPESQAKSQGTYYI